MREINGKPGLVGFDRPAPKPRPKLPDIRTPSNYRVGYDNGRVVLVFDAGLPGAVAIVLNTVAADEMGQMMQDAARAPIIQAMDASPEAKN